MYSITQEDYNKALLARHRVMAIDNDRSCFTECLLAQSLKRQGVAFSMVFVDTFLNERNERKLVVADPKFNNGVDCATVVEAYLARKDKVGMSYLPFHFQIE